jgi:hypothetical protein
VQLLPVDDQSSAIRFVLPRPIDQKVQARMIDVRQVLKANVQFR